MGFDFCDDYAADNKQNNNKSSPENLGDDEVKYFRLLSKY